MMLNNLTNSAMYKVFGTLIKLMILQLCNVRHFSSNHDVNKVIDFRKL